MLDEVLLGGIASCLFCSDLRLPVRDFISCSDASEDGGSAAEARIFKAKFGKQAEQTEEDLKAYATEELVVDAFPLDGSSKSCEVCGSGVGEAPCPTGCCAFLCSLPCLLRHMSGSRCKVCRLQGRLLPSFVEGFCGARAPLTWAVARCAVRVGHPLDLVYESGGTEFFTREGFEYFEAVCNEPGVAWEHWGPDCKLMCRARGWPIHLDDGRVLAGPQAVRSALHPLGFPNFSRSMQGRVDRSNAMAMYALNRLEWRTRNWGFAVVEHPKAAGFGTSLWRRSCVKDFVSSSRSSGTAVLAGPARKLQPCCTTALGFMQPCTTPFAAATTTCLALGSKSSATVLSSSTPGRRPSIPICSAPSLPRWWLPLCGNGKQASCRVPPPREQVGFETR